MTKDIILEKLEEWTRGLDPKQSWIKVFENIRNIPYGLSPQFLDPRKDPLEILTKKSGGSLSKHYLLGLMFEKLGIPVKYISYTYSWNDPDLILPINLRKLAEKSPLFYHFNLKAYLEGNWILVDATWDPSLKKMGFPVNENFDGISNMKNAVKALDENTHQSAFECARYIEEKRSQLSEEEIAAVENFSFQLNHWLMLIRIWDTLSKSESETKSGAFSDLNIHQTMIKDKARTLTYKKAIENSVKNTDIVLDLGCGTGILSFFAAKKGCRKVYAIDKSDIIESAIETAIQNNLDKDIEFIKTDIFEFKTEEKIDVLLHEQIGVYLWDEDLVSKVAYIRDNFLKPDGRLIPFKIDLYLVPINHEISSGESPSFWGKKKYGIDFSNLKAKTMDKKTGNPKIPSMIKLKDTKTFLCKEKLVYTVDLRKETDIPQKITASFRLKNGLRLSGMCAFFKVHLDENNVFSTRPKKTNTHWGQIFMPCPQEKEMKQDSILNFTLFPKIKGPEWKFTFEVVLRC